MRLLVVLHSRHGDAGLIGEAARRQGHEVDTWVLPEDPQPHGAPDAVLVMGGTPHPDQETDHPWLLDERELMLRWIEQGVPLLGVCLGGQQLARALGGETAKLEPAEIGWYPIHLSAEAAGDPLFGGEPRELVAYQSHRHRFGLPPGAVPLASSDLCLQAFRHGDRTWALQFHPEVTMEILERWFQLYVDDVEAQRIGFHTPSVRDACRGHLPSWQGFGVRVAERFLALADGLAAERAAA